MNTLQMCIDVRTCDLCDTQNTFGVYAIAWCDMMSIDHGEAFWCLECIQSNVFDERTRRANASKHAKCLEAMRTTCRCPACGLIHKMRDMPTHLDEHTDRVVYDCCDNDVIID
jgi:hypothetical protein